jgi:hypothetical protein
MRWHIVILCWGEWPLIAGVLGLVLSAVAPVRADDRVADRVAFSTDVVPVLTRLGCNGGGCHGKSTGQNGFRLSLLGYEPEFDYESLVGDDRGRRLLAASPERSLLLQKAVGSVPHGGGRRTSPGSESYQILERWMRQGMPGPRPDDPTVVDLEVSPRLMLFAPEQSTQVLQVSARLSDGRTQDVTGLSVYQSNEPEIADVSESGEVRRQGRSGQLAVMVRYGDRVTLFEGTIPFGPPAARQVAELAESPPGESGVARIDRLLARQWARLGVEPSPPAGDAEFVRRATLDICGTLPTVAEVQAYVRDPSPDKKRQLIDQLLARPEYPRYFGQKWADILQNRGRGYSTSRQRPGTALFSAWIRDCFARNLPYDQFVTSILTASGSQETNPATVWYRTVRTTENYVESFAQAFLGIRVQCAQCHHHPAERWSQSDYYGLAAVFGRVGRKGGFADAEVPTSETIFLADEGAVKHPRTGELLAPRPLGGEAFPVSKYVDPRVSLARWLTDPANPQLARTMANRMWAHFLGRGVIHPVDDSRSTNPPSNPELLDALTHEFQQSGYDIQQLIRLICLSRAYGLGSLPSDGNRGDQQSYARFYPRRLSAEVLLDAISQVVEVPTTFSAGGAAFPEGTRAIDLPDEAVPSNFLDVFGRPARSSACECERVDSPALGQMLELVSSAEIQEKLANPRALPQRLAGSPASQSERVRELFATLFARDPSPEELATATEFLSGNTDPSEAYRSLVWSLLATNEFLFNH